MGVKCLSPYCGFDLQHPNDERCWASFHRVYWPFVYLLLSCISSADVEWALEILFPYHSLLLNEMWPYVDTFARRRGVTQEGWATPGRGTIKVLIAQDYVQPPVIWSLSHWAPPAGPVWFSAPEKTQCSSTLISLRVHRCTKNFHTSNLRRGLTFPWRLSWPTSLVLMTHHLSIHSF